MIISNNIKPVIFSGNQANQRQDKNQNTLKAAALAAGLTAAVAGNAAPIIEDVLPPEPAQNVTVSSIDSGMYDINANMIRNNIRLEKFDGSYVKKDELPFIMGAKVVNNGEDLGGINLKCSIEPEFEVRKEYNAIPEYTPMPDKTPIPEPSTLLLLATGAAGLVAANAARKKPSEK